MFNAQILVISSAVMVIFGALSSFIVEASIRKFIFGASYGRYFHSDARKHGIPELNENGKIKFIEYVLLNKMFSTNLKSNR